MTKWGGTLRHTHSRLTKTPWATHDMETDGEDGKKQTHTHTRSHLQSDRYRDRQTDRQTKRLRDKHTLTTAHSCRIDVKAAFSP